MISFERRKERKEKGERKEVEDGERKQGRGRE